jgi:RsiW-degrading membrane proteinase PrsW (M82 family)
MDGATERADGTRTAPARPRLGGSYWVLAAGLLAVLVALLVANAAIATILAALVVPVVLLVYVRRAGAYGGAPVSDVALIMLGGAVVGGGLAALTRLYVGQLPLAQVAAIAQGRPPASVMLLLGVTVPLVAEVLKLAGPLLLRRRPGFCNDVFGGAVLGAASGVGYAAASTLVNYWPIVRDGHAPMSWAGIVEWTATLLGLTILKPLMHGATSGLIVTGIYAATVRRGGVMVPMLAGMCGAVAYSLGELLLSRYGTLAVLTLHGLLVAIVLTLLRRAIRA